MMLQWEDSLSIATAKASCQAIFQLGALAFGAQLAGAGPIHGLSQVPELSVSHRFVSLDAYHPALAWTLKVGKYVYALIATIQTD